MHLAVFFFQCVTPVNICVTTRNSTLCSRSMGFGIAHEEGQRRLSCERYLFWLVLLQALRFAVASGTETTGAQKPKPALFFIFDFLGFHQERKYTLFFTLSQYPDLPVFPTQINSHFDQNINHVNIYLRLNEFCSVSNAARSYVEHSQY